MFLDEDDLSTPPSTLSTIESASSGRVPLPPSTSPCPSLRASFERPLLKQYRRRTAPKRAGGTRLLVLISIYFFIFTYTRFPSVSHCRPRRRRARNQEPVPGGTDALESHLPQFVISTVSLDARG
ncbi:hypothetical protein R3P38DRAFT_3196051 [Favolaschia claudopus]|uniref:Transmembrane protein n=1 Tax=Favolaschia claudopus TaxID=2862362 RepID=A0AAW0BBX2_9AGAR